MPYLRITLSALFAFALLALAAAPLRAQDVDEQLTPSMWEAMQPVLHDYLAVLDAYNKDPRPESEWFTSPVDLRPARLPEGTSIEDKQVVENFGLIGKAIERMRGAHNLTRQELSQMHKPDRELAPLQLTMMQAMAVSVAQAYDEWIAAHERLADIVRRRKGQRLPKPAPPLLLRDIRDAAFPRGPAPVKLPATK